MIEQQITSIADALQARGQTRQEAVDLEAVVASLAGALTCAKGSPLLANFRN